VNAARWPALERDLERGDDRRRGEPAEEPNARIEEGWVRQWAAGPILISGRAGPPRAAHAVRAPHAAQDARVPGLVFATSQQRLFAYVEELLIELRRV